MSAKINTPKQVHKRDDLDGSCLVGPMYLAAPDTYFIINAHAIFKAWKIFRKYQPLWDYIYSVYGATFLAPTTHSP